MDIEEIVFFSTPERPPVEVSKKWVHSEEISRILTEYLDPFAWKKGQSILEIGSGNGQHTVEVFLRKLPRTIVKYVATDSCEELVEIARRNYSKEIYSKVEFMTLDCQARNIPAHLLNQFDYVVSFFCFHWFVNIRQAMENIFNMLKPGGKMIATFFEENMFDEIFHNLSKHPRWGAYGHRGYVSDIFSKSSPKNRWTDVLTETGFVVERMCREPRTLEINDELENFFQVFDPFFKDVPVDEKEAYLKDFYQVVERGNSFTVIEKDETGKRKIIQSFGIMFVQAKKPRI